MNFKSAIWLEKLASKKSILLIGLFVLFILFRVELLKYYNSRIVDRILSKISTHWLVDITLYILSIVILIFTLGSVFKNKRVRNDVFFITTFLFSLFIFYRLFSHKYIFTSFYWFSNLKYVDCFFLLFSCILLLKTWDWINKFKKPFYFNTPFYVDYPISSSSEDIFKRTEFAERLAEKIQSELLNKNAGALAIGINGAWGAGKTSFLNLIKEKIKLENRIVIEFNPWRSITSEKIIEDLFELLVDELKEFNPSLSKDISKYASSLTKIEDNTLTKSIEAISEYIFNNTNKNENYDRINEAIRQLKKQIIIFIDDLDRLDLNESIEVLRLIRNTANFNNLVYVVSYDKNYVLEAVKRFNPYNYRSFLEKIFQFEFLLPGFDNAVLRNELKDLLNSNFESKDTSVINAAIDFAGYSGKNLSSRLLKNKRDILRFTNALLFEIKAIKDEVNFVDFYLIQLLKLKFTGVYKFIADHFDLFFITDKGKIRLRLISEKGLNEDYLNTLRLFDESRKSSEEPKDKATLFEEYIKGNISEGYTQLEKDIILEIVDQLLKEKDYRESSTSKDYKSFVYSKNFNTYFNIKLLETNFTAREFEEFRYTDFSKYKGVIFKWINRGRISDVLERLEKIVDFSSLLEWENHLKILIEIAKYQQGQFGPYGINYKDIVEVLNFPDKRNAIVFFQDRGQYLEYIREFFRTAPDPYIIESSILTAALTPYAKLPFSDLEIQSQLFEYFRKYCNDHKEITNDFRELHKNAVKKTDVYGRDFEGLQEAQELFVEHFKKYLTGKQLSGFIHHTHPETDLFDITYDWVKTFFPEPVWANFQQYLNDTAHIKEDINHYNEYMEFFEKFKSNDFKPVEFIFAYLEPSLWTSGTKTNPAK